MASATRAPACLRSLAAMRNSAGAIWHVPVPGVGWLQPGATGLEPATPAWQVGFSGSRRGRAASVLQASRFRRDVIAFRLNARPRPKTGSEPAFRRNEAEHVYTIEAAHNPEVAGSNPAPATVEGPGNGAFCLLGLRRVGDSTREGALSPGLADLLPWLRETVYVGVSAGSLVMAQRRGGIRLRESAHRWRQSAGIG